MPVTVKEQSALPSGRHNRSILIGSADVFIPFIEEDNFIMKINTQQVVSRQELLIACCVFLDYTT